MVATRTPPSLSTEYRECHDLCILDVTLNAFIHLLLIYPMADSPRVARVLLGCSGRRRMMEASKRCRKYLSWMVANAAR